MAAKSCSPRFHVVDALSMASKHTIHGKAFRLCCFSVRYALRLFASAVLAPRGALEDSIRGIRNSAERHANKLSL